MTWPRASLLRGTRYNHGEFCYNASPQEVRAAQVVRSADSAVFSDFGFRIANFDEGDLRSSRVRGQETRAQRSFFGSSDSSVW